MYHYIIVDDEVIIRKGLINKINEISSIEIQCAGEAANGVEGLQLIEEVNPDIIITDMKMAKMDGMEFLERIGIRFPNKPVIVISGYKVFDYLNKAIEERVIGYVLKPFSSEEIEKQLKKAIAQIEQQKSIVQLRETVASLESKSGQNALLEAILSPWSETVADESNRYYLLITVNTKEKELVKAVKDICKEFLSDIDYYVLQNPSNGHQLFIVMSSEQPEDMERIISKGKMTAFIVQDLIKNNKIFICMSDVFKGLNKLNKYYNLNDKMLRGVRFTDQKKILASKEYEETEERAYPEEYIKNIFFNLKYHPDKSNDILTKFIDEINAANHTLGEIGDLCGSLIHMVNDYAVRNKTETDDIMKVFYKRYLFCGSIEKIRKEISGYIILILQSIQINDEKEIDIFNLITDYIDNNYHKKLTIQDISSRFFITPAYCGNMLKERLNRSFNDYLSEIRLEKAKQLLLETNLSAESISDEIGYSNPKYFFKIFKKMTGYTPIEYRNLNK